MLVRIRLIAVYVVITGLCFLSTLQLNGQQGQAQRPKISSITVCVPLLGKGSPNCPIGVDTEQPVMSSEYPTLTINERYVRSAADEHSSVLPPNYLSNKQRDYLFFLASGYTHGNTDIGAMVLQSKGPDKNGQWFMQSAAGYGDYGEGGYGTVFLAPVTESRCPAMPVPDETFDQGYAAPGTVIKDPTRPGQHLLMFYEGANTCIGAEPGGSKPGTGSYITMGVATSNDGGVKWPRYQSNADFKSVLLPWANATQGPNAPDGAFGSAVCTGNTCPVHVSDNYGRYPVLSPVLTLDYLYQTYINLFGNVGNSEPAVFLNDVHHEAEPWVYAVYTDIPGKVSVNQLANGRTKDLVIARARLKKSGARLVFYKWDGTKFESAGLGGEGYPFLPDGDATNCADPRQERSQGSISFVQATRQYLLVFVCNSLNNPFDPTDTNTGSGWFYSVTDKLDDPTSWSTPQLIDGTYEDWNIPDPGRGCPEFHGWYPTFMSLKRAPGKLGLTGYAFYTTGALGACNPPDPTRKRVYSSRLFSIATQ